VRPAEQGNVVAQLKVGAKAPTFTLNDQAGKKVKLSDFKGRRVVVYFYPKADTPGCTNQACSLQEALPMMRRLKAQVIGISPDPPEKQQKFAAKYGLKFPLLADEDHTVADAWGVWGDKTLYGRKYKGIVRSAFVIDEHGKIAATFYKVSPMATLGHATEALQALGRPRR
jgi:peroxiredoxin Q/BCP